MLEESNLLGKTTRHQSRWPEDPNRRFLTNGLQVREFRILPWNQHRLDLGASRMTAHQIQKQQIPAWIEHPCSDLFLPASLRTA